MKAGMMEGRSCQDGRKDIIKCRGEGKSRRREGRREVKKE